MVQALQYVYQAEKGVLQVAVQVKIPRLDVGKTGEGSELPRRRNTNPLLPLA